MVNKHDYETPAKNITGNRHWLLTGNFLLRTKQGEIQANLWKSMAT